MIQKHVITGESLPGFNARAYKESTLQQWQETAPAWHRWTPQLSAWLGPATETMLDMVGIRSGSQVLDIAAGTGEQSLRAARRVGPNGRILATDISSRILEYGRRSARQAGFRNVETRVLDGEHLDLKPHSFDAVISRLGLIYFPDQRRALKEMHRVLRPGGKVGTVVFSTPERTPLLSIPVEIIRRRTRQPAPLPGQPGPFSLGGPGVIERAFGEAGFERVETSTVAAPPGFPSATECVHFERESFGALHQMMRGLTDQEREDTWEEIEQEFARFETSGGFSIPCELVIAGATK